MRNRLHNVTNPAQGGMEKVLCICSAGLLRSPSLAHYLNVKGYNARACGHSEEYALIPIDIVLASWADIIVFVNKECENAVMVHSQDMKRILENRKLITLEIPDIYQFRSPELMKAIDKQCQAKGLT